MILTRGLIMSNFAKKGLSAPSRLQQCSDQGLLVKNIKCLPKPPINNPYSLSCPMLISLWLSSSISVINPYQSIAMAFHVNPLLMMKVCGMSWTFAASHGNPWHSMECHGIPCNNAMENLGIVGGPCLFTYFRIAWESAESEVPIPRVLSFTWHYVVFHGIVHGVPRKIEGKVFVHLFVRLFLSFFLSFFSLCLFSFFISFFLS